MDISLLLSAAHAPPPTSPVSSYSVPHPHGSARASNDVAMPAPSPAPWARPSELAMSRVLPSLSLGAPLTPLAPEEAQRYALQPQQHQPQLQQLQQQQHRQDQHQQRALAPNHEHSLSLQNRNYNTHYSQGPHGSGVMEEEVEKEAYYIQPSNTLASSPRRPPTPAVPLPRPRGMVTDVENLNGHSPSLRYFYHAGTQAVDATGSHSPASSSLRETNLPRQTERAHGSAHTTSFPQPLPSMQELHFESHRVDKLAKLPPEGPTDGDGDGSKQFQCIVSGCDATFGQKGSLTRHVKNRHSLNCRPHACDICSKTFSEKWTLNVHRRNVHLKLKAHNCPQCNKSFGEKWNLRKHINVVHLHVKPFSCHICDRAFGYKGDMVKHVAELHSSSSALRPFICNAPGCGVKFARMRYLRRHQNLNHKDIEIGVGPSGGAADADNMGGSPSVSPVLPTLAAPRLPAELGPLGQPARYIRRNSERSQDHVNNLSLFAAVASSTPPQVDGAGE